MNMKYQTMKHTQTLLALIVALGLGMSSAAQAAEPFFTSEGKVNENLFTDEGKLKEEVKIDTSIQTAALWKDYCGSCHGQDGKGRTRAGRRAGVKDFTDPSYQASFNDFKIADRIVEGVIEDGKQQQKPFGPKLNDKEIEAIRNCKGNNDCSCPDIEEGRHILKDDEIKALRKCVSENRCRCPHEKLTTEEIKAMIPFIRGLAE
jgi:mono/diheme cytochrome c family protein